MSDITRRDFINGTLVAVGSSMLAKGASSQAAMASLDPSYYPPTSSGLRGSHPGSNNVMHSIAFGGNPDWGAINDTKEEYDLVVVGGGISGLSAAYFYQKDHGKDKKVLILDNHDDFGGHAKRNEHDIDGDLRIGYGGTQSFDGSTGSDVDQLLDDIGVDIGLFDTAYDFDFFSDNGLSAVTYFDAATFGVDKIVNHPYCNHPNYMIGIPMFGLSNADAAAQAPLDANGQAELLNVLNGTGAGSNKPYYDYLQNDLGVTDPLIMLMARNSTLDWGHGGAETMSKNGAEDAGGMGFTPVPAPPWIYHRHFPDGNSSLARGMVKHMIPHVGPGTNAEELIKSKFNYAELDNSSNTVRVRLNSTAVHVEHDGSPGSATEVFVRYVNDGKEYQVKGKGVVMACYNNAIPHIVPNLPAAQETELSKSMRSALIYTSVGLRNWRAIKDIGMGFAMCFGSLHQSVMMDFPVSMGGYEFTKTPDDPCVIQMISLPFGTEGAPLSTQVQEARWEMLSRDFSFYEDSIRTQLTGMFPAHLFDFDTDVTSISVNRWAHGYASSIGGGNTTTARQPFGRITIANSDSQPSANSFAAMRQARRAVDELP